jgi:DNA/RNA-binding domain of Phe-tRNA-synthetase-like protein
VSFIDAAGRAHARRWTHRQSGQSAVRDGTSTVLVVIEAVHGTAREDADRLAQALASAIENAWSATVERGYLRASTPAFVFD